MKTIQKTGWLFAVASLFTISSCKENILELKNQNQYSDATYFKEAPQFNEALVATYAVFLHNGMYAREWYYIFDLLGNDAERDAPLLGDLLQLHNYSFGSSSAPITQLWQSLYRMIFRANLVIDKASLWKPTIQSDIDKQKQYLAEAYYLRAYAQFYLVTLWGRVPLKPDYASSQVFAAPRSSVADSWKAVESDLAKAIAGLPLVYASADLGRATQGAAIAMLGKAYLYQKKYADAVPQFEKLTKAPFTYKLNSSIDNQFSDQNTNSPETVFDVPHKWADWSLGNQYYMFGGQEAWGGKATHTGRAQEYGWNDWRNVVISDASVQAFKYADPTGAPYIDPRARLTFYGDAASGGDTDFCQTCPASTLSPTPAYAVGRTVGPFPYPYNQSNGYRWRKYEPYENLEQSGGPQSNINSQLIRYADVLLMLAESYINTGKVTEALPLINQVRARAGAFAYPSLGSPTEAMSKLMLERRLEFMGEQSRWFDLVRWGIAKQTLNAEKQKQIGSQPFQDKHLLLPIPQFEKDSNPALSQDVTGDWN